MPDALLEEVSLQASEPMIKAEEPPLAEAIATNEAVNPGVCDSPQPQEKVQLFDASLSNCEEAPSLPEVEKRTSQHDTETHPARLSLFARIKRFFDR